MYPPQGAPAAQPPTDENLPLSTDDVREWWSRLEQDRRRRKDAMTDNARLLLKQYLPRKDGGEPWINSNIHFRNTALKTAEMWAQFPELILSPLSPMAQILDPQTGQPLSPYDIIAVKRAVLLKLLGRDYANVDLTIRESLFDIFQTSGIGFTKICYEADVTQAPAPENAPGAILGLATPPAPQPVVMNERVRWYRFSFEKGIIPSDFTSTRWDEAPYLGMEFVEPLTPQSLAKYNLPPDFQSNVTRDELIASPDRDQRMPSSTKLLKGVELWLYACYFDPTAANSQIMRRLVLIEGLKDKAAIYTPSPYQRVDQNGKLAPESMVGNPIHPICLRVASDTAYVPPDAAFTDPLVRIQNTMMAQDLALRDSNLPRFLHAVGISGAIDKLKNLATGQGVAIPDETMLRGVERLIAPLPKLERAESDERMRSNVDRMQDMTLGISPNQAGGTTTGRRSATETAIIQQNVSVRLKAEQAILLGRVLEGTRKFDALVQQFWDAADYIEIVGQDGARKLMAYNQAHLSGRYAFDAQPDSQLTIDNASKIKHFEDFVNFMAKSGWLNMGSIGQEWANLMGYGGKGFLQQPQPPPPPPPDHPKTSIALTDVSLGIPEVLELLKVLGVDLTQLPMSPQLLAAMQIEAAKHAPPSGAMPEADTLSKHKAEETGQQGGAPPVAPAQPQAAAMPPPPARPQ
jgi:hypothetical protein